MGTYGKIWMAVLLILYILPGCLGSNQARPTRFYLLNPVSSGEPLDTGGRQISVELRSLDLPQYLEKPQIVTRTAANRLELAEYHQWGGNLRKNISRVMKQNLCFFLSTPYVAAPPFLSGTAPDVQVEIEIMAFEGDDLGRVFLRAQWRLFDGGSGRLLISKLSDFERPVADSGRGKDGIVTAMNEILADCSMTLARAVLDAAEKRG